MNTHMGSAESGEAPKLKELSALKDNAQESLKAANQSLDDLQNLLSDSNALSKELDIPKDDLEAALTPDVIRDVKSKAKALMISVKHFRKYAKGLISSEDLSNIKQNTKLIIQLAGTTFNKIDETKSEMLEVIRLEAYKHKRKKEFHLMVDGLIKEECINQSFRGKEDKILNLFKNNKFYNETIDKINAADKSVALDKDTIFDDKFNLQLRSIISEIVELENRPKIQEVNIFQQGNKIDIKFYGSDLEIKKLNFAPLVLSHSFNMKNGVTNFNVPKSEVAYAFLGSFMTDLEMNRAFQLSQEQKDQLRGELGRVLSNHIEENMKNCLKDVTITGYSSFTEGNFKKCKELAETRAQKARIEFANQYGIKDPKLIDRIKIKSEVRGHDMEDILKGEFDQKKEFQKLAKLYNADLKEFGMNIDPEDIKDRLVAFNEGKLTNINEQIFFIQYIGNYRGVDISAKESSPLNLDVTASTAGPVAARADAGKNGEMA